MKKSTLKKIYIGLMIAAVLICGFIIVKNDGINGLINVITGGGQTPEQQEIVSVNGVVITEDGHYQTKDEVALYIYTYGHLPSNYMTKSEAKKQGWKSGALDKVLPGYSIGGDRFGNNEGLLPVKDGRTYTECDIETEGEKTRGSKRIVFSNDGLVYYTEDHYSSYTLLYGKE